MQVKFENLRLRNPQGLDQILSEILRRPIRGDWDKNIPPIQNIGTLKRTSVPRRVTHIWGTMLEKTAREYLAENLQLLGWSLKSETIRGREFDCIARAPDSRDRTAELAVEMYFPIPKTKGQYHLAPDHSIKMITKLTQIQAKRKYVLIGIPKDVAIEVKIFMHPTIKILFQEYKFKKMLFLNQQ
jgi:hypothetical protein